MAQKSYHVRFGDRKYTDDFGFRGRGTFSIDDKFCTYTGKKPWPDVVRVVIVVVLVAVFGATAWVFTGYDGLGLYLGILAGFVAGCIAAFTICASPATLDVPLAAISKVTLEGKTVIFTAKPIESEPVREGVLQFQLESEARDLHTDITALLMARPGYLSDSESTQSEAAPEPANGVFWWAKFVLIGCLLLMFQTGGRMFLPMVVALVTMAAACEWWYSVSKLHHRRSLLPRLTGYILFALGSISPISAVMSIALANGYVDMWSLFERFVVGITFAPGMVGIAYWFVFKPSTDTGKPGTAAIGRKESPA